MIKRLRLRRQQLKINNTKNAIKEFVQMPLETIKEMDLFEGNAEKQLDLEEAIRVMPQVKCSIKAYTMVPDPKNDEEFVESEILCASDLVKIEFRIEHLNLGMEDREGYVHTRNYPYLKKHSWHFMLVDG